MSDTAGIYARHVPVLGRCVQIGVAQGRVLSVEFPETPPEGAVADHPLLDRIAAYLDGEPDDFADVTVALTLPTDRRRVLETVSQVPYGESTTVEQLLRMTAGLDEDEAEDRQTVEAGLTGNPAPLLVPDHRVRDGPGAAPDDVADRCRRIEGL
jgi:methylated-DNA-[protein]-cysteine S-methyltransferase